MLGKLQRLENIHIHERSRRIQGKSWKAKGVSPAGLGQKSTDRSLAPTARKSRQLVMVDFARRETSVGG
jgi:hypothetical protein